MNKNAPSATVDTKGTKPALRVDHLIDTMSVANRGKRLVSRRGLAIAAVLAVLGVASLAGAAWVFTDTGTETVTERTAVQTFGTEARTSALVTGNSTLYERGERLEEMPIYFLGASPNLTVTIAVRTPGGAPTNVSIRLAVVQRATRNDEVFFSTNETLINATATRVIDGRVNASTEINMSRLRAEISRTQDEIGGVGLYRARLELSVEYETDQFADREEYAGSLAATAPIGFTSGAYLIEGSLSDSREHAKTRTYERTEPADPMTYGGLAVLGVLLLGAAATVVYGQRAIDAEELEAEFYHEEYEEWISEGEFPTGTEKRYIKINDLEDLIDIAIDTNKRVIFDPSLEVYSVVDGDLVYYHSRDPFSIDVWLDT